MTERRPAPLRVSLTIDSLVVITLTSTLLLVAGWGYAEQWFAQFDLGLVALGLPVGYFGFYGYQVLTSNSLWLLPVAGLTAMLGMATRRWLGVAGEASARSPALAAAARKAAALAPLALPVLVLLAFFGAHALGQSTARWDYDRFARPDNGFCRFPYVHLVLEDGAPGADDAPIRGNHPALEQDLADGQGRLLLQGTDLLVVILPLPGEPSWHNRRPTVVIPTSKVRLLELAPTPCR